MPKVIRSNRFCKPPAGTRLDSQHPCGPSGGLVIAMPFNEYMGYPENNVQRFYNSIDRSAATFLPNAWNGDKYYNFTTSTRRYMYFDRTVITPELMTEGGLTVMVRRRYMNSTTATRWLFTYGSAWFAANDPNLGNLGAAYFDANGYLTMGRSNASGWHSWKTAAGTGTSEGTAWDTTTVVWDNNLCETKPVCYVGSKMISGSAITEHATLKATGAATQTNTTFSLNFASATAGAGVETFSGEYDYILVWNRALSEDEVRSIAENPWQLWEPDRLFLTTNHVELLDTDMVLDTAIAGFRKITSVLTSTHFLDTQISEHVLRYYRNVLLNQMYLDPELTQLHIKTVNTEDGLVNMSLMTQVVTRLIQNLPLDSNIFLDRKVTYAASVSGNTTSLNMTQYVDANAVFVNAATGELLAPLLWEGPQVIFNGQHPRITVGILYPMKYKFTKWYPKGQSNVALLQGRLQFRSLNLYVTNTGGFKVTVETPGRNPRVISYEPSKRLPRRLKGSPDLKSETFKVPVRANAEDVEITLSNDSHLGSEFHEASFEGDLVVRSRSI